MTLKIWRHSNQIISCKDERTRVHHSCYPVNAIMTWKKIFQNGSSICRLDLEKMDSRISSTMKPEIEVVKRTCAEPQRRRVSVASRWFCETLWRQIGRIIEIFTGNGGVVRSARVKTAHGEQNRPVVKLVPVF